LIVACEALLSWHVPIIQRRFDRFFEVLVNELAGLNRICIVVAFADHRLGLQAANDRRKGDAQKWVREFTKQVESKAKPKLPAFTDKGDDI
jgi:hypothetical protein